jgi:hypothetical protein
VTVPVGGLDPVVETVAVKVTLAPTLAGFKLETRVVVVDDSPPEVIVSVSTGDMLPALLESPV